MSSRGNHMNLSAVSASILQWGSNFTPLAQSNIVAGYIPVVLANGTLQLLPPSGLTLGWPDVLADNNTSGANDAIMSAGRALNFADNIVRINSTVDATATNSTAVNSSAIPAGATSSVSLGYLSLVNSPNDVSLGVGAQCLNSGGSNRLAAGAGANASGLLSSIALGQGAQSVSNYDVVIGSFALSVGTGAERVVIGRAASGGSGTNSFGIACGSGAVSAATSGIALGRLANVASGATNSIGLGLSATPAGTNDVSLGPNSSCPGTGGSGGRVSLGSSSLAGAASVPFSIAIGANSTSTGSSSIAVGRLATASALQSYAFGFSTSAVGNNDFVASSGANTTNSGFSARIVIGVNATSSADQTCQIGANTIVSHNNSAAFGRNAQSTSSGQIMLGNNATGGTSQVYCSVGTTGTLWTEGFLVSNNQVRASISPSVTQNIASGSAFTLINQATVTYASDIPGASPAITSVASRLQTRQNRTMSGFFSFQGTFTTPPVANGYVTIRIMKGTNGVPSTMAAEDFFVLAGRTGISVNIPFTDFTAGVPAPNIEYYCDCDNNAVFGAILQVQTSTHFVANMIN